MRVLVIANNFPTPESAMDGAFVLRQLQALRNLGHEFRVVRAVPHAPPLMRNWAYYRKIPDDYEIEGIPVRVLRTISLPREANLETYARQLRTRLRREIEMFGARLIHAHGVLQSGSLAVGHGLPVVLTAHGTDAYDMPWRRRGLRETARRVARDSARCVAVSEFIANFVRRLGAKDVRIVPNGGDDRVFQPVPRGQARAGTFSEDERIIAFAGRLDPRKGVFDLIDAAASLRDLDPLVVFAGDGPARQKLERRAEHSKVRTLFLGPITHDRLAHLYAAADVVTLPSYREGLPAVLCEAMLMGRAVVAAAVGGIPEIVEEGRNGYLHEPGDVRALGAGLRNLLTDADKRVSFERASRTFAANRLTWSANARDYDLIYKEVT